MIETQRVVVVGASGFGRECLDVLDAMIADGGPVEIAGVVDDGPSAVNLDRLAARGVVFLGSAAEWLTDDADDVRYVLGIGSPDVRRRLVALADASGRRAFTAVHPTATLGAMTSLGDGVVVCAGACISTNVRLGRHVHINPNVTLGHDSILEDFVSINPAATISGEVVIGEGSLVGTTATVLQNLSVGANTVVGAAALVTKDVPAGVIVKGVPGAWA